jgi:phenylacetate-CoA ligase
MRHLTSERAHGDAYTRLVSGVLFPIHDRLRGLSSSPLRRALEASQWWSPERIASLQLERLQSLLRDAARDVPYYRSLFARMEFAPDDVRTLADLARLPLLAKSDIRANPDALKSVRAGPLFRSNTGGSSGEPLVFHVGVARKNHDVAAKWRATRWWGVDIGDPEVVVWGSPIELGAQDRLRALRDRLFRTTLLPAFGMSETALDRFVGEIRRIRPRMLFGYPSALAYIARHAEAKGTAMDDLGIRVAFVTAERLYDEQRAAIERVFRCRVANGYGGRDAGFIAHACLQGSLHISAEDVIVETVAADGRAVADGEAGEIVVTHLASRDYPFIRYRTGDVGILDTQPCGCGRGLPVLKSIEGRSTDFVVAADGTVLHGLALIYVVRDLPGIGGFRIVQESTTRTRVEVVPAPGYDPAVKCMIVDGVRARLGAGVDVEIAEVPRIAPERSGKYRYVVSRVRS